MNIGISTQSSWNKHVVVEVVINQVNETLQQTHFVVLVIGILQIGKIYERDDINILPNFGGQWQRFS